MRNPIISVILPVYNHEKFVGQAIESVLSQTFSSLELIVINDGSTDNSDAVIRGFKDPRISYYCQENRGSCYSHNKGLQLAKGEYISIINSDDVYHKERLENLYREAIKDNLQFLITDIELIDQNSSNITDPSHWWIKWYNYLKSIYLSSDSPAKALLAGNYTISTSNFFFHSSIIKEVGFFHPYRYILDYDFAFRVANRYPDKFKFLTDRKLLFYRLHGENTILSNPLAANYETFYFLKKAIKDIFGNDIEISIDYLGKINRYILKEIFIKERSRTAHLINEIHRKNHEIELKLQEIQDLSEYSQRLWEEVNITRNSLSYKIGRGITFFPTIIRNTILGRNIGSPLRVSVNNVKELAANLEKFIDFLDIISFDIFDTIFERDIDPPDKVKEVVSRYMSNSLRNNYGLEYSYLDILKLRDSIELELRHKALVEGKDFECRYSDIIRGMVGKILGYYDENLISDIIRVEIDIEDEVLYIKEGMVKLLEWLKAKGKKIIAISDMYLEKEHILNLFQRKSIDYLFDNIYVSSEMCICKYSGNLFRHVMLQEKVTPNRMVHVGDNKISDYKVLARMGINAIYLEDKSHLKKKYILKTYNWLAARNIYWRGRHLLQLIRPPKNSKNFFYNYGFSFLGPVYSAFVYGVVEILKKYEIKYAYFVAREGALFLQIFNILAPYFYKKDPLPVTEYVYLTRKSTALPSAYKGLTHEKAIIALYNPKQEGLESVIKVFGLRDKIAIEDIAKKYGFIDLKEPIYNWYDTRFINLLKDREFQNLIVKQATEEREILRKYLEQIGFFSASKVALVDIGWNATIQKFLQDAFIEDENYPNVFGLYLGFRDGIKHNLDRDKNTIIGLLYDERHSNPSERILKRFEEIFEEGARALHPTTIGYFFDQKTKIVSPIFKGNTSYDRIAEIRLNNVIKDIQNGVIDFSREFLRAIKLTGYSFSDIKPFISTIIERCIAFPNSEETDNLFGLMHAEDFGYESIMDFNEKRLNDYRIIFSPKRFLETIKKSNWSYGTARSAKIPGLNILLRLYDIIWNPQ